jgi:adenine-specific DNA-methyltransferase
MNDLDYPRSHPAESSNDAKSLGAYYTDAQAADFLAWWALRSATDTVLDPCFGGGIFLRSASKRLLQLGGRPESQVFGIEIDEEVHRRFTEKLTDEYFLGRKTLVLSDFFNIEPTNGRQVHAVIGNPPFIRYQRFTGEARRLGLSRSLAQGVRLPELCSSWAPFIIHCIAMLRPGGRLAMVLPMEVGHAKYARPVLEHIRRSFGTATFLTFQKKLFPDLNEDTILLLADDKGAESSKFMWRDLAHPSLLSVIRDKEQMPLSGTRQLDAAEIASGESRLIEHLIPSKARELYRELKASTKAQRLGVLADVGIGYVTGANDYFHLAPNEAKRRKIPGEFLKPAIRRGRSLTGLRFTSEDWSRATETNEAGLLLHIGKSSFIPKSVREYLDEGEAKGVEKAYKCRMRSPWYCVPHVYQPDAFLTYMSGVTPRLVANDADVVAPNSLHVLRIHAEAKVSSDIIAALWQTSLTRLSVEIEGHALGGGMLKLEPTEAENVLVPSPGTSAALRLARLAEDLDELIRNADEETAHERADAAILKGMLGLSPAECKLLRTAADALRSRRGYRSSEHESA